METEFDIKCVAVGDGAVGKTSLLQTYSKNKFPEEYEPTVFDNYNCTVYYNNKTLVSLNLWDTAGQEDYDSLRPLSYPETDVFLLCFSTINQTSFMNIKSRWINELKQYIRDGKKQYSNSVSIVLCGLKIDLRENADYVRKNVESRGFKVVTQQDGLQMAQFIQNELGILCKYVECSSKSLTGLKDCFQEVMQLYFESKQLEKQSQKPSKASSRSKTSIFSSISHKADAKEDVARFR